MVEGVGEAAGPRGDDGPLEEVVVLAFDAAEDAREGLANLRRLHRAGHIRLSAAAVIGRRPNGRAFAVEQRAEHPAAKDTGRTSGLAGLLTGPFGLVLDNAPDALVGSLVDIADVERSHRLLRCFGIALPAGCVATVALVAETRPEAIERVAARLQAGLMRKSRADVEAALRDESDSAISQKPGPRARRSHRPWSRVRAAFARRH